MNLLWRRKAHGARKGAADAGAGCAVPVKNVIRVHRSGQKISMGQDGRSRRLAEAEQFRSNEAVGMELCQLLMEVVDGRGSSINLSVPSCDRGVLTSNNWGIVKKV